MPFPHQPSQLTDNLGTAAKVQSTQRDVIRKFSLTFVFTAWHEFTHRHIHTERQRERNGKKEEDGVLIKFLRRKLTFNMCITDDMDLSTKNLRVRNRITVSY